MERWRKGIEAVEVERAPGAVTFNDDRGLMADYEVSLLPEHVERIRLGYVCIDCYEPHEHPFPQRCQLCGYPMREYQAEKFNNTFKGEARFGPTTSIADEVERMNEEAERERRRLNPQSRIWVPGDPLN